LKPFDHLYCHQELQLLLTFMLLAQLCAAQNDARGRQSMHLVGE
jgi:hypothetical protein